MDPERFNFQNVYYQLLISNFDYKWIFISRKCNKYMFLRMKEFIKNRIYNTHLHVHVEFIIFILMKCRFFNACYNMFHYIFIFTYSLSLYSFKPQYCKMRHILIYTAHILIGLYGVYKRLLNLNHITHQCWPILNKPVNYTILQSDFIHTIISNDWDTYVFPK